MLDGAKREAERANAAKSRFLAAASHDLRQPLQSLTLLIGLLRKVGDLGAAKSIADRSEESLAVMSGMLNTLLDINRIEVGAITVDIVSSPIDRLFDALRDEFSFQAEARRLDLRVVPCSLSVRDRSGAARADGAQPALERPQVHPAGQGAARLPVAAPAA